MDAEGHLDYDDMKDDLGYEEWEKTKNKRSFLKSLIFGDGNNHP